MANPASSAFFFGDPGCGVGVLDQLAHVSAAEAERRLEAKLLDRVERSEVGGLVEAIEHRVSLIQCGKQKTPSSQTRMAFVSVAKQ